MTEGILASSSAPGLAEALEASRVAFWRAYGAAPGCEVTEGPALTTVSVYSISVPGAAVVGPVLSASRGGTQPPRLAHVNGGVVLDTGLQNRGVNNAIQQYGKLWEKLGCPVIVQVVESHPATLAKIAGSEGGGRVTAVAVGGFHGCGLASNGGVECWGANGFGQLDGAPNGSVGDSSRLPGPYLAVSAGDLHSCALKADGGVDCWGRNGDGQLDGVAFGAVGMGSRPGPYTAVSTGSFHSFVNLPRTRRPRCWPKAGAS